MSTEIVTAAEKPAELSEPGFVPLIQLLNNWDEARKKLFYFSAVKCCTAWPFNQVTETRVNFQKTDGYKPL